MSKTPPEVPAEPLPDDAHLHRRVLESIRDQAIFLLDRAGAIATWPVGAQQVFGYTPAEAIGRCGALLHPVEARAANVFEKQLARARAEGSLGDEGWHLRKDGSRFWATGTLTTLVDAEGCLEGFVKVSRAGTAPDVKVEALRQAKREADAAAEQFLAAISHELRTPLMPILLWTHILDREEPPEPLLLHEGLDMIRKCAEQQQALIDRMVTTARSSLEKAPLPAGSKGPPPVQMRTPAQPAGDGPWPHGPL